MITVTKVKLGKEPKLFYHRDAERCELDVYEGTEKLIEAASKLQGIAIDIAGLDVDRWNDSIVIGITFKPEDDGFGFVATLMNKEDWVGTTKAVTVNTPYLSAEDGDGFHSGLSQILKDIQKAAIAVINSQPKQLLLVPDAA